MSLNRLSPPAHQQIIEREGAAARDRQPEEQGEILELVESQQRLQRVDVAPFGGADGDDHGDAQSPGGNPGEQSQQQEQAPEEFDSGSERRKEAGEWDSPADEIFGDLRQIVELAPAAPEKYPTYCNSPKQRREPHEVGGNALGPANEPIDQLPHARLRKFGARSRSIRIMA